MVQPLSNVAKGDPHVSAHNEERTQLNDILAELEITKANVNTKADEAEVLALIEQQSANMPEPWTVDPTDPDVLIVTPSEQLYVDPANPDVLNIVV